MGGAIRARRHVLARRRLEDRRGAGDDRIVRWDRHRPVVQVRDRRHRSRIGRRSPGAINRAIRRGGARRHDVRRHPDASLRRRRIADRTRGPLGRMPDRRLGTAGSDLERPVANALTPRNIHTSPTARFRKEPVMPRRIVHRTRGQGHGPIVRLMSPSDLGQELKPFVFLDLFEADLRLLAGSMPVHPHSGIATVTVFSEGDVTFDDPHAGRGTIEPGGVEWARAGKGMWHGHELSAGRSPKVRGFQLWLALPPDLETAEADSQYVLSEQIPTVGPARVLVGAHGAVASPVRAPGGINYLLVTLNRGEQWTYAPPSGHTTAWVAVSRGTLHVGERVSNGELAIFDQSDAPITLEGSADLGATLVLGSAVPHPYPLHLGAYSVHTSAAALAAGERHIRDLKKRLDASGDLRRDQGSTPVFRG